MSGNLRIPHRRILVQECFSIRMPLVKYGLALLAMPMRWAEFQGHKPNYLLQRRRLNKGFKPFDMKLKMEKKNKNYIKCSFKTDFTSSSAFQ